MKDKNGNPEAFQKLVNSLTDAIANDKLIDLFDFSALIDGYTFVPSKKYGVVKPEISDSVCKAAFSQCPFPPADTLGTCKNGFAVSRLGHPPYSNEEQAERSLAQLANQVAANLTASPDGDILLRVRKEGFESNQNISFQLAAQSLPKQALKGIVSGVYGQIETSDFLVENTAFFHRCYGKCRFIQRKKEVFQKERSQPQFRSWVTNVMQASSFCSDFSVDVQLHPLDDIECSKIEQHIETLQKLHSTLAFNSEVNWSNTLNGGENLNGTVKGFLGRLLHNVKNTFVGFDRVGANFGLSYTLSSKEADKQLIDLIGELDFEITRLNQVRNDNPWSVTISISAAEEGDLDILAAAVAGAFEPSNLCVEWTQEPCTALITAGKTLHSFAAFPIREFPGFSFAANEQYALHSPSNAQTGIPLGNILWNSNPTATFYLPQNALNRHAFICGMTGSGKTNTLFKIIEMLNKPFMVVEPVKGEYRALRSIYPDATVWTMKVSDKSRSDVRVLQLNPFWFPEGSSLSFHIDSIKTILSSAFDLYAAMPNIVEQCLFNIYIKAGWDLITNRNLYAGRVPESYLYPTFSDLTNEVENYLNHSDFGDEVLGNYKGALLSRLKSFTNGTKGILMNTQCVPDYAQLISGRNVIELEGLADDADKCLVMGTIMIQYYQYLKHCFNDSSKNQLQHIIVIEEAHRLFKNIPAGGKQEGPNPTGQLVDSLCNIMAEIRAFGEGMVIVDQSPSKVSSDVIKNSSTKIIHRIDNQEDIKLLRSALLLPERDMGLSLLSQGQTLIRTDGMQKACKVKVFLAEQKEAYSLSTSFQTEDAENFDVRDIFNASIIIQDNAVYADLLDELHKFTGSLVVSDFSDWYDIIYQFILGVHLVLRENHMLPLLGERFNGLKEVISQLIRKYISDKDTVQGSLFHMLVMRMVDLYWEVKDSAKIRPRIGEVLEVYIRENLTAQLLGCESQWSASNATAQLLKLLDLPADTPLGYLLAHYTQENAEALALPGKTPEITPEKIKWIFFAACTYLDESRYPQYDRYFEIISDLLNRQDSCLFS